MGVALLEWVGTAMAFKNVGQGAKLSVLSGFSGSRVPVHSWRE